MRYWSDAEASLLRSTRHHAEVEAVCRLRGSGGVDDVAARVATQLQTMRREADAAAARWADSLQRSWQQRRQACGQRRQGVFDDLCADLLQLWLTEAALDDHCRHCVDPPPDAACPDCGAELARDPGAWCCVGLRGAARCRRVTDVDP